MKLRMGPGSACSRSAPQPHWNTATVTPMPVPTESRNPSAALTGTSTERNTAMSSTIESPTTMRAKGTSALVSRVEMSMPTAVTPVTASGVPYSCSMSSAIARMSATTCFVSGASGANSGATCRMAVSSPGDGMPCPTLATPSTCSSSPRTASRSSSTSTVCVMSSVTRSGPAVPGPNASAMRS